MSKPVATLTSWAAFEADATAAYQNALVCHFVPPFFCYFVIVIVDHFL
jgi:hypothetical protein